MMQQMDVTAFRVVEKKFKLSAEPTARNGRKRKSNAKAVIPDTDPAFADALDFNFLESNSDQLKSQIEEVPFRGPSRCAHARLFAIKCVPGTVLYLPVR